MLSRLIGTIALVAGLSACSGGASLSNAFTSGPSGPVDLAGAPVVSRDYAVQQVIVNVPDTLVVSEENGFYPFVDIVWRGDPIGDRQAQIKALFDEAAARSVLNTQGARPVIAKIDLVRFHGVTERTRFSIGGNYNIIFDLTIRDAQTAEIIEATRRVVGDLAAPGGNAAVMLEQQGQTEKVRVTDFLTFLLQNEIAGSVAKLPVP